mgnify:CR=1 FL=1
MTMGSAATAADLFFALSDAWIDNMRRWDGGRGLPAVRGRWLERAAGLGSEIVVRLPGEVMRGRFESIDDECRLILRDRTGTVRRIAAGDVHFGVVASADAAV